MRILHITPLSLILLKHLLLDFSRLPYYPFGLTLSFKPIYVLVAAIKTGERQRTSKNTDRWLSKWQPCSCERPMSNTPPQFLPTFMQVFLQCRAWPDLSPVPTSAPRVLPPNQTIHSLCCYDNSKDTVGWFFLRFTSTGAVGERNQWQRGRRSRETVRVEDETACRRKKSRKQAEKVLRYRSLLTVLATKH